MVNVTLQANDKNLYIAMDGHANSAPTGADLVCAGCSAIIYSLIGYLDNYNHHYTKRDIKKGRVKLSVKRSEQSTIAWEMASYGLMQLANQYPENVKVTM